MVTFLNSMLRGFSELLGVVAVLLTMSPVLAGYTWDRSQSTDGFRKDLTQPSFGAISTKIDAGLGETVLLPCIVSNLGDKVVSWIRTKDLSILTSGAFAFSSDNRFESVHSKDEDSWGLRIRGVKIADSGQYECQVNTDPKMNLAFNLTVSETKPATLSFKYASLAKIKSPKDVYARIGSPISLLCEITPSSENSVIFPSEKSRVLWTHNGRELTSESDRGGISVDTDYRERKITSRLRVAMVTYGDGGLYACSHPASRQDSIKLNVFQGEHTEAMQRDAAFSAASLLQVNVSIITYLLLYIT